MSSAKYKKGMVLQSKTSSTTITLTNIASGKGYWETDQGSSESNYKINEETLDKFYEIEGPDK